MPRMLSRANIFRFRRAIAFSFRKSDRLLEVIIHYTEIIRIITVRIIIFLLFLPIMIASNLAAKFEAKKSPQLRALRVILGGC